MSSRLLICESPGKIKKLKQILGSDWNIKASMGHVVELANEGEDSLGFTLDSQRNRIDCCYVPRGVRGKQVLKDLREAVKQASEIFIATDPDREGETIGWHLVEQLRIRNPKRVTYTEITDRAVKQALSQPRSLDLNLVAAGRCRDTLDKLVGYKGSPLLWKLGNGAKSMGRVQSATLHILCQREREIKAFIPQDYWNVYVDYEEGFRAYYAGTSLNQAESGSEAEMSDDAKDSKEKQVESLRVLSQEQADHLVAQARSHSHQVARIDATSTTRKPPAPFTTSSLQQAAGSRLKFGPEKTMKVAQALYEQGHITYMRTDSIALADDYCQQARQWLEQHDPENVPQRVATQRSKAGAQEAHEAIRPTHVENTPDNLSVRLSQEEAKLYFLIWGRAIASLCQSARLQKTRIVSRSGEVFWQARGQVVTFQGYTKYWNDISSDSHLPVVQQGQTLKLKQAGSEKKQTQPPPRYSEPKLVQTMEKRGIGRPSTYAPTVKVLREREYASLVKGYLHPTQLGMEVDDFLMRVLPKMVEPEFTAEMESALDGIAAGKQQWEPYIINWNETYFAPALKAAYQSLGSPSVTSGGSRKAAKSSVAASGSRKAAKSSVTSSGSRQTAKSSVTSGDSRKVELTQVHCPKCEWLMQKIPCRSEKLKADHFLKCSNQGCGTAMFWSSKNQVYELPYSELKESSQNNGVSAATRTPSNITEHACPVCSQPLELYEYTKENQQKQMLRCSDAQARRRDDHKNVAYFAVQSGFWSPSYGEIGKRSSSPKSVKVPTKTSSSQSTKKAKRSKVPLKSEATSPSNQCPVCGKPLELYEYSKGSDKKQMLRCSDTQARRQDDHKDVAFFSSRGTFWSAKYGEMNN